MSRIKLILSILLMLFLLLVAIFLPSRLRERKETPDTKSQEETATQEESNQPEKLTEMDFLSFEELSQFFSSAQTVSLKEQFPVYLTRTGRTDITSQNICRMKFLRQLSQAGGVLGGEKGENSIFFSHRETS